MCVYYFYSTLLPEISLTHQCPKYYETPFLILLVIVNFYLPVHPIFILLSPST